MRAVVVFSKRIKSIFFFCGVVDEREGGSHGLKFDRSILIDFGLFFFLKGYHILLDSVESRWLYVTSIYFNYT